MLRDNPLKYILSNDGFGVDFMYKDDADYVLKEMDFFNSYYQELVNNSPLLCHMGIEYFDGYPSLHHYFTAIHKYETENGHWSPEGHSEVAKLLEKFINDKYYD